jgi:SAM-dependent methyltransferase
VLRPETETVRWYEENVRRFGYGFRSLGFGQKKSQEKRFEAVLGLGALHGKSVLDAGCGFGDLLPFLLARGIRPRYSGIDICPPMIERCQRRFPASARRFAISDVLDYRPRARFDYVIASGLFGLNVPGAVERVRPTLELLFDWCRIGLVVNFLSKRTPRPAAARLYLDPGEMLRSALRLTPAVRLDHSYLPNDFALLLYRTPAWEAVQ